MKKARQTLKKKNLFDKSKAMAREVLKVKWGPQKKMNSHKQWVSALGLSLPDTNKNFGVDFANMPSQFTASSSQSPVRPHPEAVSKQVQPSQSPAKPPPAAVRKVQTSLPVTDENPILSDFTGVTEDAVNCSRQAKGGLDQPQAVPAAGEASRDVLMPQSIRSVKTVGLKFFTHRCHICLASFRSKEAAVAHIEGPVHSKHTRMSPCHCPYCYFPVPVMSMLKEHLENSHGRELQQGLITYSRKSVSVDYSNVLKPEMFSQVKPDDVFACQACDQDFESFHMMHNHLFTKHKSMTTVFCALCQTTIQETDVETHDLVHFNVRNVQTHIHNRFDGDMSSAFFIISKNEDDDLLLCADPTIKGYKCKFCLYEHDRLNRFKSHVDVHLVASPAKCNNCGDQLMNTSDVYFHYLQHNSSLTSMSLEDLLRSQFCCGPADQVSAEVSLLHHSVAQGHSVAQSGNTPKVDLLCAANASTSESTDTTLRPAGAGTGGGSKDHTRRRSYIKIGTNRLSALINEGGPSSSRPHTTDHRTPRDIDRDTDDRPSEGTTSKSADRGESRGSDPMSGAKVTDEGQGDHRSVEPVQPSSGTLLNSADKQAKHLGESTSSAIGTGLAKLALTGSDRASSGTAQAGSWTLLVSSAERTKHLGKSTSSVSGSGLAILAITSSDNMSTGTVQVNGGNLLISSAEQTKHLVKPTSFVVDTGSGIPGVASSDRSSTETTQAGRGALLESSKNQTRHLGESTSGVIESRPGIPGIPSTDNSSVGMIRVDSRTLLESSDKQKEYSGQSSIRHVDVGPGLRSDPVRVGGPVSSGVAAEPQRKPGPTITAGAVGLTSSGISTPHGVNQMRHPVRQTLHPVQIAVTAPQPSKQFTFSINNLSCKLCKTLCKQHHTPDILDKQPSSELLTKYDIFPDQSSVTGKSYKCLVCFFKSEYCIVIERHVLYHEPMKPCVADMKFKCHIPGCQFATSFELLYDHHRTHDHVA